MKNFLKRLLLGLRTIFLIAAFIILFLGGFLFVFSPFLIVDATGNNWWLSLFIIHILAFAWWVGEDEV